MVSQVFSGFPACSTQEAPLNLTQSGSHLQATCMLVHTEFCCWFESNSAKHTLRKIALLVARQLFLPRQLGSTFVDTTAASDNDRASGSDTIQPQHSRVEPPRSLEAHGFVRLQNPLGTAKRRPEAPLTSTPTAWNRAIELSAPVACGSLTPSGSHICSRKAPLPHSERREALGCSSNCHQDASIDPAF